VEILRSAGLEEAVRRRGEEQYHPNGGINNVESLAGREIASYCPEPERRGRGVQPDRAAVHRPGRARADPTRAAEELGAELRYRVECSSLAQDGEGVTATLHHLDSGSERTVRSRYLVAADGNRSRIREQLGLGMLGSMVS
jgi:putative polyketide hydroxylase